MRLRLPAPSLTAALACALLLSVLAAPAEAARAPGKVGLVSITKQSLSTTQGRTTARIRLSWPKAARAKTYEVFVARTKDGVQRKRKPTVRVRKPQAVVSGLRRNTEYWFQVRAVNGSRAGSRSNRVARITMIASAAIDGSTRPLHSVMSYNVCSNACGRWSKRQVTVEQDIARVSPGVVAVQEASQWKNAQIPGYAETEGGHDNRIFYRTSIYEQATRTLTPQQQSRECEYEDDPQTGDPVRVEPCVLPVDGVVDPPGKNMPWALLRHRGTGQEAVFVSIHLQVDTGRSMAAYRADQSSELFQQLRGQLAWWGLDMDRIPVVLIGDFNTNRSRAGNARLDAVMHANGFYDAYEQARNLSRQHYNTANPSWATRPVIGVTWGDHVDKVWIRPGRSRVATWANVGRMSGGSYVAPLGSDHHPLRVQVRLL